MRRRFNKPVLAYILVLCIMIGFIPADIDWFTVKAALSGESVTMTLLLV